MDRALGMIEFKTIAKGLEASDAMVKTAEIKVVLAQTMCPGRFLILVKGKLGAVKAAIEKGKMLYDTNVRDSFILGNPHETLYDALDGKYTYEKVDAMGIIETSAVPSILFAADQTAKAAEVKLVKIALANNLGGKGLIIFTGEIAAVEESIQVAALNCENNGTLIDFSLIPNPDKKIWDAICD
ncbi:BMC domain-containing protein [Vallitalea okinawensis]|uniref:BMC domain-containing protein n=1 Tax=Vallitalea okinawensis TaxID=2078660 RepID=UPI000CFC8C62|nr:BMC domain-containing protein [Vallitalea okinawensis]